MTSTTDPRHRETISTPEQAQSYINSLIDAGLAWHWDDDPADVVWDGPAVAPQDFDAVRQRIAECQQVSWAPFEDIHDYTLSRQGTGTWEASARGEVKVLMQWTDGPLRDAKGEPLAPGWYYSPDFDLAQESGPFPTRAAALEDHGRIDSEEADQKDHDCDEHAIHSLFESDRGGFQDAYHCGICGDLLQVG